MSSDDIVKAAIAAFRAGTSPHPACLAWREMTPIEQSLLADDIAANGLRDAITITPAGELLDGRNRKNASAMAGYEIPADKIIVFDGDPYLYSISKNARRRHMSTDEVAMVVAAMVTTRQGDNQNTVGSNELTVAKAAEAAGIPETAVKSAKAVLEHGTAEEIEAVRTGKAKARKTADTARRRAASRRPAPARKRERLQTVDAATALI